MASRCCPTTRRSSSVTTVRGAANFRVVNRSCRATTAVRPPSVSHSFMYDVNGLMLLNLNKTFETGTKVFYVCEPGYKQRRSPSITCNMGDWSGQGPECILSKSGCSAPPTVEHGDYSLLPRGTNVILEDDRIAEGSQVFYYCHNGYKTVEANISAMSCNNGEWVGQLFNCGELSEIPTFCWRMGLIVVVGFQVFSAGE